METLGDSRVSGGAETTCAPRTRHGTKLQDILMSDKPNLSYADFHHELTRNPDAPLPKYVGSKKSQRLERRNLKEEELVKYMSNLPSYLERGKNCQEKPLNVGVLDWRRLEKWRHSQNQIRPKHSINSPSSSNTSLFSTDGSSTHSSRGQSRSPARQRPQHISQNSAAETSPKDVHVQDAKASSRKDHSCSPVRHITPGSVLRSHPQKVYVDGKMPHEIEVFGGSTHKFQDSAPSTGNWSNRQHKVFGVAPLCGRKGSDLRSLSEVGRTSIPNKYQVASTGKGKSKIQDVEFSKETGISRESKLNAADRGCSEGDKSSRFVMPKDLLEHTCSGFTGSASITENDRLSVEPGEKSLLASNNLDEQRPFTSGICSQPEPSVSCFQHESGAKIPSLASHMSFPSSTKKLQAPPKMNEQGIKLSGEPPHASSFHARLLSSPSRRRHSQEKLGAGMWGDSEGKPSEELDARKISDSIPKPRHPSPIRRLSFAMGKMIRNVASRDDSPLRRSNSKDCIAKSVSHAPDPSLLIDNPCRDKLSTNNSNNRGRSSPLRRLLDPLLKPRVSNCSEPSNNQTLPGVDTMNSHSKPPNTRPANSIGVHLRSASASDAHHNSKNGSSTLQALLQVSFKNGLPLFTFAIDNEKNILAATLRKSTAPGKGHHSWIYTFFAIHEVKRKSVSWLNHGGKGGNHGYVPNVVAQMKVSDFCGSSSVKLENEYDVISREFDLFAVDAGQGDEYSTDFHPTNELAAIIVTLPQITTENNNKADNSTYGWLDISQGSLIDNSQLTKLNDNSGGNSLPHHYLLSPDLSTTLVLPGGVHTVPSKGELSRLAQRWRFGGQCDCGGWDLGCQLRVYTNRKEPQMKFGSFGTCQNKDKLQLFPQVGQDNQPILSLVPFKERIYSVEFNSSLSLLQAFAVSASFIDCKRPPELSAPSNVPEKVTAEVGVFEVPVRPKMSNQADAPGRYVSYPPHSPVGRV
ncbi:hypothetical protein vseg_010097 [Gypsophila vaccaria]